MEWWQNLLFIVFTAVLSAIISYLVARWQVMYKKCPKLPIHFRYYTAWFGERAEIEASLLERKYLGIEKGKYYNILSIHPPSEENEYYSTDKYEWHFKIKYEPKFNEIQRLGFSYGTEELNYKNANNLGNDLGPWYPHLAEQGSYLSEHFLNKINGEIWWIFYFKDNYDGKNHCKCRRFQYAEIGKNATNWRALGNQHNNSYGLWDSGDKICKTCPFKDYIKKLNDKRKWDKS